MNSQKRLSWVRLLPDALSFYVKKLKRKTGSGKNPAMWGEEAKPLENNDDAERKSDL